MAAMIGQLAKQECERIVALASVVTTIDNQARRAKDEPGRAAVLLEQRDLAISSLVEHIRTITPDDYRLACPQDLPPLLHIAVAARLCGITVRAGYMLAEDEWLPFIKRFGKRSRAVRTAGLLAWLEQDGPGTDEQPAKQS